jgi:hypothetical protein
MINEKPTNRIFVYLVISIISFCAGVSAIKDRKVNLKHSILLHGENATIYGFCMIGICLVFVILLWKEYRDSGE